MEFFKTIYREMLRGNFSLAILVVGGLQLLFQIITFIILILDRRLQKLMFGKKKKSGIKGGFAPLPVQGINLEDAMIWQQEMFKQIASYKAKLREAKKLITEAELEFGKKVGDMDVICELVNIENSLTFMLSKMEDKDA